MGNKRLVVCLLIVAIILLVLLALSYVLYQPDKSADKAESNESQTMEETPALPGESLPEKQPWPLEGSDWTTFSEPELGISFKYPASLGELEVKTEDYTDREYEPIETMDGKYTPSGKKIMLTGENNGISFYVYLISKDFVAGPIPGEPAPVYSKDLIKQFCEQGYLQYAVFLGCDKYNETLYKQQGSVAAAWLIAERYLDWNGYDALYVMLTPSTFDSPFEPTLEALEAITESLKLE